MATLTDFMKFDQTPYQRIPNVNTRATLALTRALRERTPNDAPKGVAKEAGRLDLVITEAESLFTDLHRDETGPEYGVAVTFDAAGDKLWSVVDAGLLSWSAFEHPGFDAAVAAGGKLGEVIEAGRAKADRAHELRARLFGEEGLQALRTPFHEQSESTAAMVRLISEDELQDDLDELTSPELIAAVIAAQPVYEEMVGDRLSGSGDELTKVRELLLKLRFRIGRYNARVLGMLDEEEPESLELVKAALQPLIGMREEIARRGRAAAARVAEAGEGTDEVGEGEALAADTAKDDASEDEAAPAEG